MGKGEGKGGMMLGFGGEKDVVMRRESYADRMRRAWIGVVVGSIFFLVGLVLIVWNEYRTVQTQKAIALGEEAMIDADCGSISAAGSLVLVKCDLTRSSADPITFPAPPVMTQAWDSPSNTQVAAPSSEQGSVWATTASYYEMGVPDTAIPLKIVAKMEVRGWVEHEQCDTSGGGGSRMRRARSQTCTYTYEQEWISCDSDCQVQASGWRNTEPSPEDTLKMQANADANTDGRYMAGQNPIAHMENLVYVQGGFLGTSYPLTPETIDMISARDLGMHTKSGSEQLPTNCMATTPWSSASSYYLNCEYEKYLTESQQCNNVLASNMTTCNPTEPPTPAPPTQGTCVTTPLQVCNNIQVASEDMEDTCEAELGCTFRPATSSGEIDMCVTTQIPACAVLSSYSSAHECTQQGSCTYVPPPQGGSAGTCYPLPVAQGQPGTKCCLDATMCDESVGEHSIGQRRASFDTLYGSDATIVAEQKSDGTFTKWIPEGVDEAYSPWYYGSFGKKHRAAVLEDLSDKNSLMKVIWRFVGWLLTWVGLQMLTGPLTFCPDIIPVVGPVIGDLMGHALCCATLMVSLTCSFLVGATAWIFVRPLLSFILIIFCAGFAAALYYMRQNHGSLTGHKPAASKHLPMGQVVAVREAQPGMEVDVLVPIGMVSGQLLTVDPDGPEGPLEPVPVRIPEGVAGDQVFKVMIPEDHPPVVVANPVS